MKRILMVVSSLIVCAAVIDIAYGAVLEAPNVIIATQDNMATVQWDDVAGAEYYLIHYALPDTEGQIDLSTYGSFEWDQTAFSFVIWDNAAFWVAVQGVNEERTGYFSNILYFDINHQVGPSGFTMTQGRWRGKGGKYAFSFELWGREIVESTISVEKPASGIARTVWSLDGTEVHENNTFTMVDSVSTGGNSIFIWIKGTFTDDSTCEITINTVDFTAVPFEG